MTVHVFYFVYITQFVKKNRKKRYKNYKEYVLFILLWTKIQNGGVCMDKKIFNKSSNFFKKEGFYVILFVCLCVVATVAAITTKNNKVAKEPIKKDVAISDQKAIDEKEHDNALQVKKPTVETPKTPVDAQKASDKAKAASTTNNNAWVKPVVGKVIEPYRDSFKEITPGSYVKNLGLVIECKQDADVVTAYDGKVEDITVGENGTEVIVDHNNGYKTVYSNLQDKLNVTKGKTLHKGDKIGKVNAAVKAYTKANCLYFKVLDKSQNSKLEYPTEVDPARFIKY